MTAGSSPILGECGGRVQKAEKPLGTNDFHRATAHPAVARLRIRCAPQAEEISHEPECSWLIPDCPTQCSLTLAVAKIVCARMQPRAETRGCCVTGGQASPSLRVVETQELPEIDPGLAPRRSAGKCCYRLQIHCFYYRYGRNPKILQKIFKNLFSGRNQPFAEPGVYACGTRPLPRRGSNTAAKNAVLDTPAVRR